MKRLAFFILIITFLISCSGTKEMSKAILTETTWQLKSLNGDAELSGFSKKIPHINFTEDDRVSGNTGCNSFNGAYSNSTNKGTIVFSRMVSTKMYCDGVPESEFLGALNQVNTIKKSKDELIFLDNDKTIMVFVPKE
ncbi:META domain-containing protein [Flavobacterium arcticum]|uniref:META domain-containing protein n=1 Tax=Flavobacterium arcticum TaxID=1784713 RepID=A0A345HD25_9FLAO|nr:META domain-containing protein [Flavobacterium arcticum]AXG74485.1 META domain-containing protein [Flavobacterium arcticum]KAF2512393.1 META domain-containing protein [Flavobacterium arcticum]